MAEQLKNTLAFDLAPAASVVIPHELQTSLGTPLAPDIIFLPSPSLTVSSDEINITLTNVGSSDVSGTVLVESWHTIERAFGGEANKNLPVKPYVVVSEGADADAQFTPARTLFVSPVWPAGINPTVFFTTIKAALIQASTLVPVPSQTDPATIIIYPGAYPEDLDLVDGVSLIGAAGAFIEVNITGDIFWNPVGTGFEVAFLYHLTAASSVNIDTTGKTGGQTSFLGFNCFLTALNEIGRASSGPTRDLAQFFNCIPGAGPGPTFFSTQAEWIAGRLSNFQFSGDCLFKIIGGTTIPAAALPNAVNDTSTGTVVGSNLTTDWNVGAGASVTMSGCDLNAVLNVDPAGFADVRASNYNDGNLAGPGPTNRTTHIDAFGPTVIGANLFTFAVPFPDDAYNVALQLTAGPGSAAVTVTLKNPAGTDFTINDPVGGNTFDIIVIHD